MVASLKWKITLAVYRQKRKSSGDKGGNRPSWPSDPVLAPLFRFFASFCLKLECGQHRGVGGKRTATRGAIILGWDHCLALSVHASGLLRLNRAAQVLALSHRHARSDIQGHFLGIFASGRSCFSLVRLSTAHVNREIYWVKVKWAAQCFRRRMSTTRR